MKPKKSFRLSIWTLPRIAMVDTEEGMEEDIAEDMVDMVAVEVDLLKRIKPS